MTIFVKAELSAALFLMVIGTSFLPNLPTQARYYSAPFVLKIMFIQATLFLTFAFKEVGLGSPSLSVYIVTS
jgi:hypothetical protein